MRIHGPEVLRDTSTNWGLVPGEHGVEFPCPNCGSAVIVRSYKARKLGITYRCPVCGFEGP